MFRWIFFPYHNYSLRQIVHDHFFFMNLKNTGVYYQPFLSLMKYEKQYAKRNHFLKHVNSRDIAFAHRLLESAFSEDTLMMKRYMQIHTETFPFN